MGDSNKSPLWSLPADLRHFREVTMGHTVIMGRKTHEGIGRALPGRKNIVISRQPGYQAEDCVIANSLNEALKFAEDDGEVFVTGGGQIYAEALPKTNTLYLTYVDADIPGDIIFSYKPDKWQEVARTDFQPDEENIYPYSFLTLTRKI